MFEKGIFIFAGIVGLANLILFILSIYLGTNLFKLSCEKF
jgi:hypothetical protein